MQDEVKIFASDNIHNLLVGKQPRIGQSRLSPRNVAAARLDGVDFSSYPFPEAIEPSGKVQQMTRPETQWNNDRPSSKVVSTNYHKVRATAKDMQNMSEYLTYYETNSTRKTMLLHQDIEEHYLQPFTKKLVKQVNGENYNRYLKTRNRAVTAFDKITQKKDTFNQELPEIPMIKFKGSNLTDPVQKYKVNNAHEANLSRIIAQSTGTHVDPPVFPERDTMNLKRWTILSQTRFYEGTPNAQKGKRIHPGKFDSQISREIETYKSEKRHTPRPQRRPSQCQVDHIKFG